MKDISQSEIFTKEESNNWYERNRHIKKRNPFIDYFLEIFPKKRLTEMDIAEFGIGNARNLKLLSNYVKSVSAFDASFKAIENFNSIAHCLSSNVLEAHQGNLAETINTKYKYNLIIYGFFSYVVTNTELEKVRINTNNMLKDNGFIFVYDFLSRENLVKIDTHNENINIYKRTLSFWVDHFKEYSLLDFRLMGHNSSIERTFDATINITQPLKEKDWVFCALFQKNT